MTVSASSPLERTIPYPPDLSPHESVERILDWVKHHYWTDKELSEAAQTHQANGYEAALAFLVACGVETLRDSREPQPPRLFITIPGGRILVHQPGSTLNQMHRIATLTVGELAHMVLQATKGDEAVHVARSNGMIPLWEDVETGAFLEEQAHTKARREKRTPSSSQQKLHYDPGSVRLGAKQSWCTAPGWVIRYHGLAYVIEPQRDGRHDNVSLVHSGSNRILTSFSVIHEDAELVHSRVRPYWSRS